MVDVSEERNYKIEGGSEGWVRGTAGGGEELESSFGWPGGALIRNRLGERLEGSVVWRKSLAFDQWRRAVSSRAGRYGGRGGENNRKATSSWPAWKKTLPSRLREEKLLSLRVSAIVQGHRKTREKKKKPLSVNDTGGEHSTDFQWEEFVGSVAMKLGFGHLGLIQKKGR